MIVDTSRRARERQPRHTTPLDAKCQPAQLCRSFSCNRGMLGNVSARAGRGPETCGMSDRSSHKVATCGMDKSQRGGSSSLARGRRSVQIAVEHSWTLRNQE